MKFLKASLIIFALPAALAICGCSKNPEETKTAAPSNAPIIAVQAQAPETNTVTNEKPTEPKPIAEAATNAATAAALEPPKTEQVHPEQPKFEEARTLFFSSDKKLREKALQLFHEAAEAGNSAAQHALAIIYLTGSGAPKNQENGLVWLQKSAAQGHADAQFRLASLYMRGDLVPKDIDKAVEFVRKAAEQKHPEAEYNLGTLYATGTGVPTDLKEAVNWFRKAAESGHATAQSNLGVLYASGDGVEKNMVEAVKWWRRAAEQGQRTAQFNLAQILTEGKEVTKDLVEAYKWYSLAADQGDRDALRLRNTLALELSPEEVAEGLKRSREFNSQLRTRQREERERQF